LRCAFGVKTDFCRAGTCVEVLLLVVVDGTVVVPMLWEKR
jgi:hypothetical protein